MDAERKYRISDGLFQRRGDIFLESWIRIPRRYKMASLEGLTEPSLGKSFGSVEMDPRQMVAIDIIDRMKTVNIEQKRAIFFYYLVHETGKDKGLTELKRLLGEIREDAVERIIDRVADDEVLVRKYDTFYKRHQRALERERIPRFRELLRDGLSLKEAAQEAEIPLERAQVIRSRNEPRSRVRIAELKAVLEEAEGDTKKAIVALLNKGLSLENAMKTLKIEIDPNLKGKNKEERFVDFCNKVEQIEHPQISDEEISRTLEATASKVKRARKCLRDQGRAVVRSAKDVASARSRRFLGLRYKIEAAILEGRSIPQIIADTQATYTQIRQQRKILEREERIPKKMTKIQVKEALKNYLENQVRLYGIDHKINLSEIHRTKFRARRVTLSLLNVVYHGLAVEIPVPLLKVSPQRRGNKRA